jgi:hypothetical protein
MENSAPQISHEHHHHRHHRSGRRHPSRRQHTKKVVQRLAILFFIVIVIAAFLYVWHSSGSSEGASHLWKTPLVQVATSLPSRPSR